MQEFKGKVAVVTGAGSGIGRSLALAFAKEGMNIVIVDVNPDSLKQVASEIEEIGVDVLTRVIDVSNREQMKQLADDTLERFGCPNILCNNAGIGTGGMFFDVHLENWDWIIGVNLYGVIYGVHFFLKRMIESGEECHIINTSSMAGLISSTEEGLYNVTKYGVVALSESLHQQMQMLKTKVGVSVLCPGLTTTNIIENSKNLANDKQGLYKIPDDIMKLYEPAIENIRRRLDEGLDPDILAQMVMDSIRKNRLYIIPNPDWLQFVEMRHQSIIHDALELNEAMKSTGVLFGKKDHGVYTHKNPGFSVTYPGDWTPQNPTPFMNFTFMAVSETWSPNLMVHVTEAPENGLEASLNRVVKYISKTLGLESHIKSNALTKLKDGTPAIEGEIEVQLSHKANRLIVYVLAAIKEGKLVCINLSSFEVVYNDQMKHKLREIAYTLTFR